jgi:hypothetical protein
MNKTIKLALAGLVAVLATTVGVAAPGGATPVVTAGDHPCC